ncbi:MAG: hypothetical protein OEY22_07245 [Candidatus Bathyarchaeota archaeon]|nr:hypothetical protein [Candidatus Bathyarchaeota archaeon]MDH5788101.1 hypothetical protein [Candidatus Bathyarchaeota archaeon]
MPYCLRDYVIKNILKFSDEEVTDDINDEVDSCIVSVDGLIDSLLKKHNLAVPSSVPQNIKDASAHFAAWLFRKRLDPVGAEAFWKEANKFLQVYIDAESEAPFKVVQA